MIATSWPKFVCPFTDSSNIATHCLAVYWQTLSFKCAKLDIKLEPCVLVSCPASLSRLVLYYFLLSEEKPALLVIHLDNFLDPYYCISGTSSYLCMYTMIRCRVERRTKTLQKSVKFTRAESTTEKDKDRVCLYLHCNLQFVLF